MTLVFTPNYSKTKILLLTQRRFACSLTYSLNLLKDVAAFY